jgi:hypothetical protein
MSALLPPVQHHTNQPACLAQGQAPPKQFVGIIGITIACVVLGMNFVGDHWHTTTLCQLQSIRVGFTASLGFRRCRSGGGIKLCLKLTGRSPWTAVHNSPSNAAYAKYAKYAKYEYPCNIFLHFHRIFLHACRIFLHFDRIFLHASLDYTRAFSTVLWSVHNYCS